MKNFTQKFIGLLALMFIMSFSVNSQEIGDIYEDGYIFQINDDGTGLIAGLNDVGIMLWYDAMEAADDAASDGWYLPSLEELELIYNTIGYGGSGVGNFNPDPADHGQFYWSTTYGVLEELRCTYQLSGDFGPHCQFSLSVNASVRLIRSVTFEEDENTEGDTNAVDDTTETFLDLPEGWSMFGYTCIDSVDAMVGFSSISNKIEIVKDEWGLSYIPSWEFNAMGSLQFSEGYQIKMIEEVTDFQFCTTIAGGTSQEELDAAIAEVHAMYEGWCESDLDNDGICDVDEVSGCMDASSCNYVSEAEFDDGSCDYESCLDECGVINGDNSSCTDACGVINGDNSTCVDECGVPNGDNSSCTDCAGVLNGASEDLGCGCNNPAAQPGFDCDGNQVLFDDDGFINELTGGQYQTCNDISPVIIDFYALPPSELCNVPMEFIFAPMPVPGTFGDYCQATCYDLGY